MFQDLWHTFGTTMAAAGVPMRTVSELMRHKHISTTERCADTRATEGEASSQACAVVTGLVVAVSLTPTYLALGHKRGGGHHQRLLRLLGKDRCSLRIRRSSIVASWSTAPREDRGGTDFMGLALPTMVGSNAYALTGS